MGLMAYGKIIIFVDKLKLFAFHLQNFRIHTPTVQSLLTKFAYPTALFRRYCNEAGFLKTNHNRR
jgi:hypothetical protein